jgi:hypothetical protein
MEWIQNWNAAGEFGIKTATISINAHGGLLNTTIPTSPSNSLVGTSIGLCTMAPVDDMFNKNVTRFHYEKDLYSTFPISIANYIYVHSGMWDPYLGWRSRTQTQAQIKDGTFRKLYPHDSEADIIRRYSKPYFISNFLRSYKNDKMYSVEGGKLASIRNILILETNHDHLANAYKRCNKLTISPPDYGMDTTGYAELQQFSLFNQACADQLISNYNTITGNKVENIFNIHETITIDQIEKYEALTLSEILKYFGSLGIDHLNIIDHSCNVSTIPPELQRQLSQTQSEDYVDLIRKHDIGGRKTKRKYKKNSKSLRRYKK